MGQSHRKRLIRKLFISLLLIAGAVASFVYFQDEYYCEANTTAFPSSLSYNVFDEKDKESPKNKFSHFTCLFIPKAEFEQSFGLRDDEGCPYHTEMIKYRVGHCSNPAIKSGGSDFNGYVRISIKKGFKCYYTIQSDYKDSADRAFERVLEGIEKEQIRQKYSN